MAITADNTRMATIFYLIDKNRFALNVDQNPSRDKIERIKSSIVRKKQLFERAMNAHK